MMDNPTEQQMKEMVENPKTLFHFIIYLGHKKSTFKIMTTTIATDEGVKNREQVKEMLLSKNKELDDIEIVAMVVSNKFKMVQMLFKLFKNFLHDNQLTEELKDKKQADEAIRMLPFVKQSHFMN